MKCRKVKFINFDIWFSDSIDMTQKKFVFRQLNNLGERSEQNIVEKIALIAS